MIDYLRINFIKSSTVFFFENDWKKSFFRLLVLLLCAVLFPTEQSFSQNYSMRQFTVEDGLPSSYVYDLAQDKEGFIWISTEGGLCRFNGSRFERDPIEEGLSSTVVELDIDSMGNLWFVDLTSQIGNYKNGKVNWVEGIDPSSYLQFVQYREDKHGNDWFLTEFTVRVRIKNEEGKTPYEIKYEREDINRAEILLETPDTVMYIVSMDGVGKFKNYRLSFSPFENPFSVIPTNGVFFNDKILFSVDEELFFFNPSNDSLSKAFPEYEKHINSEILYILYDKDNLWISTRLDGVLLIKNIHNSNPVINKFLDGTIVGSILKDQYDGYWMSTEGEGLFYLPNIETKIIAERNSRRILTTLSEFHPDKIVLGFDDNLVKVLDSDFEVVYKGYLRLDGEKIYEIENDVEKNGMWFASSKLCWMDSTFQISPIWKMSYFKAVRLNSENQLWYGTSNAAGYLDENYNRFDVLKERTYAVLPVKEKAAWLGSIQGLYYTENGNTQLTEIPALHKDIHDLQMGPDSMLWIATLGDGVYLYKEDSIHHHFNVETGLLSNHCTKILLDDQYAWVATNLGVSQILLTDYSKIFTITKDEGLPSIEINDLVKFQGQLLVATNKGLAVVPDSSNFYQAPVSLHLSNIKIQEKDTLIHEEYNLDHSQNNIKIEFEGVSLRNADFLKYQYQLEGIDGGWVTTKLGVAQYPKLPSGSYTFRVKAKTSNSDWSKEQVIQFNIAKAYWEKWWFYLGLVLFAGALGAIFIRALLEEFRRRNEIHQQLKTSQLIALRARMNPHFLFNALNSIQELIIRNDKRSANRYLAKFSRLMRNILNMSDKDEVALQTEIESLELYLSLEALRFEKDFEYRFDIAPGVNTQEVKIPSMLIQPYVENAVIHGLMHRKGLKKLFINFKWERPYLVAVVEDNGVGRKRAKEIQIDNGRPHFSTGMSLTKNRLDLLNSAQQDSLSVVVDDLKDKAGKAIGTRVTIYIALEQSFWNRQENKNMKLFKNY